MAHFVKPEPIGVGIQYNPEILDWFPFEDIEVDVLEILLDNIMAPWMARRLSGLRPRR